jgi:hypothetical protein
MESRQKNVEKYCDDLQARLRSCGMNPDAIAEQYPTRMRVMDGDAKSEIAAGDLKGARHEVDSIEKMLNELQDECMKNPGCGP